jgi:hypothetical protein
LLDQGSSLRQIAYIQVAHSQSEQDSWIPGALLVCGIERLNCQTKVLLSSLKVSQIHVGHLAGNPFGFEAKHLSVLWDGTDVGDGGQQIAIDDEVIVGRTLSYRPDGQGFFVFPADPLANNIRVFVVSGSVRQVRFP